MALHIPLSVSPPSDADSLPAGRAATPRREEILQAAARVFVERGFDAATTREIGERAGVLSGSLYHHFEAKEQMLFELVRDVYAGVLAFVDSLDEAAGTPAERLRLVIEFHVRTLIDNIDRSTLFLHEFRSLTDEHKASIAAAEERYVASVTGLIEEGIGEGTFRAGVQPALARMVVLGAVNWVHRWYRREGELTPDEIAREMASLLLDGLRVRPVRKASR